MKKTITIPLISSMLLVASDYSEAQANYNLETIDISNSDKNIGLENCIVFYVAQKTGKQVNELSIEDFEAITELDLSGTNIEYIPQEIKYLTNLETLNLSNNRIKTIPVEISNLKKLKKLDLSNNKITEFTEELTDLIYINKNLVEVDLSDNLLILGYDYLDYVKSIANINIEKNPIPYANNKKELLMNDTLNLEVSKHSYVSYIYDDIRTNLGFYSSDTGKFERFPDELEIFIKLDDDTAIENNCFVKEGEFKGIIYIKNTSVIDGNENPLVTTSGINIKVGNKTSTELLSRGSTYSEKLVKVSTTSLELKKEASKESDSYMSLNKNQELTVIGEDGNYYKVNIDGYTGYVEKNSCTDMPTIFKETLTNNTSIYSGKEASSSLLGTLDKGHVIKVYKIDSDWATVSYKGKVGYIKASQLTDTITIIGEVTATKIKVLETPSEKANTLGMMSQGDRVEIYEKKGNGWYKIKYIDKVGYVKSENVKEVLQLQIKESSSVANNSSSTNTDSSTESNISNSVTEKPQTSDLSLIPALTMVSVSGIGLTISNKRKKEK